MLEEFCRLLEREAPARLAPLARFSPETFAWSLRRTIVGWWNDSMSPERQTGGVSALAVLPANSPAPLMTVTLSAWLAGATLAIKPSRSDVAFTRAWVELAATLPGARFSLVDSVDATALDYLVVFGSDETVAMFHDRRGRDEGFVGYGHAFSVAYVERADREAAVAAADDVAAWDQSGCLSPQTIFVASDFVAGDAPTFGALLAEELARREERYPRRAIAPSDSFAIRTLRMDIAMRERGRVFASDRGTAWTVLCDGDAALEPTPLERTVWVRPVAGWEELMRVIAPQERHIEAIGVAAGDARLAALRATERTSDRIVPLGRMQAPPLSRRHGGREALWRILSGV